MNLRMKNKDMMTINGRKGGKRKRYEEKGVNIEDRCV